MSFPPSDELVPKNSMWEAAEPLNPAGIEFSLWAKVYRAMINASEKQENS